MVLICAENVTRYDNNDNNDNNVGSVTCDNNEGYVISSSHPPQQHYHLAQIRKVCELLINHSGAPNCIHTLENVTTFAFSNDSEQMRCVAVSMPCLLLHLHVNDVKLPLLVDYDLSHVT